VVTHFFASYLWVFLQMKAVIDIRQGIKIMALSACLAVSPLSSADSVEELSKTLIAMRGEVEELQTQLESAKQAHKLRMDSLNTQLTDLSVETQRQTVALEKLQQTVSKHKESSEIAKKSETSFVPVIIDAIAALEGVVQQGLPFKVQERLDALAELKQQVQNNASDGKKTANRLWAFVEDELRLSRENGVYSQTITLNGEQVLADVAKLGSVMLYFQASDMRMGKAVKKADAWQFVEFKQEEDKQKVALLFDSLKKQVRQGYFELPNPKEL
jgi:hypothetical protein